MIYEFADQIIGKVNTKTKRTGRIHLVDALGRAISATDRTAVGRLEKCCAPDGTIAVLSSRLEQASSASSKRLFCLRYL